MPSWAGAKTDRPDVVEANFAVSKESIVELQPLMQRPCSGNGAAGTATSSSTPSPPCRWCKPVYLALRLRTR